MRSLQPASLWTQKKANPWQALAGEMMRPALRRRYHESSLHDLRCLLAQHHTWWEAARDNQILMLHSVNIFRLKTCTCMLEPGVYCAHRLQQLSKVKHQVLGANNLAGSNGSLLCSSQSKMALPMMSSNIPPAQQFRPKMMAFLRSLPTLNYQYLGEQPAPAANARPGVHH